MTQIFAQNGVTNRANAFGSITLPSYTGVIGEWWFGSGATGDTNRITGVNATPIGTPVVQPGYATLSYSGTGTGNGYTLDVGPKNGALAILALLRTTAGAPIICAPGSEAWPPNYNLYTPDASHISFGNGQVLGATTQSEETIAAPANFVMVMGVGALNAASLIYMATGGATPTVVSNTGGTAYAPSSRDMTHLQVGGYLGNTGFQGTFDVAAVALVDGVQGSTFIQNVYARWYAYAAELGLTVG